MQITGLPASSAFGASDVLAIEINGMTYKITGATLAAALQSMGDYVTAQDIANNLTTTDEGYVLDARQGKALLDALEAIGASDVGAVAVDQGAANAGKALVVGSDGAVTIGDAGVPDAVKTALLELVRHVAYIDGQGQAYYDALYAALYGGSGSYPRLVAAYAPGSHVVYTDDALDTLRPYLTVKRLESEQDSGTVVTDYTLSGTLVDGQSTVLVRKDGLAAAVQVEAVDFYNISEWNYPGNLVKVQGGASSIGSSPNFTPSIIIADPVIRNTVVVNHGLTGMDSVHYVSSGTDLGPSGYYLIPIPIDCNNVSFVCDPSSYYASVRVWHYDGNNNWTRKSETGWQTGNYTWDFSSELTEGDTGYYVTVNIKFNSSGSAGADVSGFSMTFGRSND